MPPITTQQVFIGIDPGASGGLCFLRERSVGPDRRLNIQSRIVDTVPMPATERDIWDWINDSKLQGHTFAVIEEVHSMPGDGHVGAFKFGASYGRLRMALVAAQIPFESVRPQAWQKALGIQPRKKGKKEAVVTPITTATAEVTVEEVGGETKTAFKNRLKAKAQELFPEVKVTLDTADALLIAEYCRRTHKEKQG